MISTKEIELRAKIQVLEYLSERECKCDKSKCSEHFNYMKSLLYDYRTQLEELNEKK